MKGHRSRFLNKKIKAATNFTVNFNQIKTHMDKVNSDSKFKDIENVCRNLNIDSIDDSVKQKCIEISEDLHNMNSAERLVFLYEEPHFPGRDKAIMLETCIRILEHTEDYEMCATLHRMRTFLSKKLSN